MINECKASYVRNMDKGWEKYYLTFVLRLLIASTILKL